MHKRTTSAQGKWAEANGGQKVWDELLCYWDQCCEVSLSLSVSCSGAVAGGADLASVSVLHSCGGQIHQSACL